MESVSRADEFLKNNDMHPDSVDFYKTSAAFKREMKRGLIGRRSSLLMLPTYIADVGELPAGREIIALDAGGTNLRVALCRFDHNGRFEILRLDRYPMLGTGDPVTAREFFYDLADKLMPITDKSDTVGFCFSYACDMLPNKDGVSRGITKEVAVSGIEGLKVCESLSSALVERGGGRKKYVLLNDTVAAHLGAKSIGVSGDCAGFILGTGVNFCYSERCSAVKKDRFVREKAGSMIINVEAGGFDKLARGTADMALAAASQNPAEQSAEKMISGAYLGELLWRTLILAADGGYMGEDAAVRLRNMKPIITPNLNDIIAADEASVLRGVLSRQDELFARAVADRLLARAAKTVTLMLGSALDFASQGKTPSAPVTVCVEGSTYYKTPSLRGYVDGLTRTSIADSLGVHINYIEVANATLAGTALAAALNC